MRTVKNLAIGLMVAVMLFNVTCVMADNGDFLTSPTKNGGQKWRIGYYEGGEYQDYQRVLVATIAGLMKLAWLDEVEIPAQDGTQTKDFWQWLSTNAQSNFLEFVADAHYSANWDNELRETMAAEIIDRLTNTGDIDFMIAAGTRAGQDLANNQHSIPTMVISTSDPIASGIIESVEDSGFDHIHARVNPTRHEREVMIFHDIIGFQRLGIAYKDTVDGRSYASVELIEKVAGERGFELVRCYADGDNADETIALESVKQCFHELGNTADAIYVTVQPSISAKHVPELVEIANSYSLPTFSQPGSEEVKYGYLMSISVAGFKYLGDFQATVMAKILNGAKPRDLEQLFEDPPKIAINLKTAEIIGYDPPVDVLGVADEIYQEIATPE